MSTVSALLLLVTLLCISCSSSGFVSSSSSPSIPNLTVSHETPAYVELSGVIGVYTNPNGVGDTNCKSPFVVLGGYAIQAFLGSTGYRCRNYFQCAQNEHHFESIPPVLNFDTTNTTLLVAALCKDTDQGNDGCGDVVTAVNVETMEEKWTYNPSTTLCGDYGEDCLVTTLVFVDDDLAHNCSRGVGGVSAIICGKVSNNCSVVLLDLDDGSVCHQTEPSAFLTENGAFNKLIFRAFPSGGALQRPMFVVLGQSFMNTIYGVDAASGTITYQVPVIDENIIDFEFDSFAAGTSPSNDFFAYSVGLDKFNTNVKYFVFRHIADGRRRLRTFSNLTNNLRNSGLLAWAGTDSPSGGVVVPTGDSRLIFYSALDGEVSIYNLPSFTDAPEFDSNIITGRDHTWSLLAYDNYSLPVRVVGFHLPAVSSGSSPYSPTQALDFTVPLPFQSSTYPSRAIAPFRYANGTTGFFTFIVESNWWYVMIFN